jgi:hypothetical protein
MSTIASVVSSSGGLPSKNTPVSGTYLHNIQDWITYYDINSNVASFTSQPSPSVGLSVKADKQVSTNITESEVEKPTTPLVNSNITHDMQDIELVSPVQGAVQQARAAYVRAAPIKRRKYKKRGSSKVRAHRRKQVRRKKKRKRRKKKPVKRLKKKRRVKKGKRKYRKKKKTCDIFNE